MTCRVFNYSYNNPYANDYYQACKNFDKIKREVIDYESRTDDRDSPAYREMIKKFEFWDAEVPKTSNLAGRAEDELKMKQQQKKDVSRQGATLDLLG